ncbi:MAG: sulfatase-like hydrolase/transferase [Spirochaetales bacterium]|nr:sulfatase-like hydrolase/transferase [Spirochaetales bacterium]
MSREKRPRVIVFFTDQQRWDSTGTHGNPLGLTPNFDRMASKGTHFETMITCQPVCAPARSCLQTGQYATQTGVFRNGLHLADDATTLATCFRDAGYHTGYIGKWHLGGGRLGLFDWKQEAVPEERRGGYEYWLAADAVEFTSDAYHTALFDTDNRRVTLPGYRVDAMTDAAIRYIAERKDDPFFLFLSFLEPHHQNHSDNYPAPFGYEERYRGRWIPPDLAALGGTAHQHLAGYWGMVKRLDEALGRLFDALYSLDILDDTIVYFVSDHGNHFKTRNGEYKRSCHESSVRVPAAAMGPGFNGGATISQLMSLVDLPPTILDSAGVDVPDTMVGRSAMPLLGREHPPWQDDVFIQVSESQVARAVRTGRWKYAVAAPGLDPMHAPKADRYVEEYLYDLAADPYELSNLVGMPSHRSIADRLKERLLKRIHDVEGYRPTIENAAENNDIAQRRIFDGEAEE